MTDPFQFSQTAGLLAQGGGGGGGLQLLLFTVLMIGAMYFLIFAPQRKKQKEHQGMVERLKQNDEVMTTAGIYGTITSVKKDKVTLRIAENTKVDFAKAAIQQNFSEEKRKAGDTPDKGKEKMPRGGEDDSVQEAEVVEGKEEEKKG
jgi:preprotein translocase subunit YajC